MSGRRVPGAPAPKGQAHPPGAPPRPAPDYDLGPTRSHVPRLVVAPTGLLTPEATARIEAELLAAMSAPFSLTPEHPPIVSPLGADAARVHLRRHGIGTSPAHLRTLADLDPDRCVPYTPADVYAARVILADPPFPEVGVPNVALLESAPRLWDRGRDGRVIRPNPSGGSHGPPSGYRLRFALHRLGLYGRARWFDYLLRTIPAPADPRNPSMRTTR